MKRTLQIILLIFLLFYFSTISSAVPASPIIHYLEQPNGKKFEAKQWGDEWNHGLETIDGYTIAQNETKFWAYAVESNNKLMPSNKIVGESYPDDITKGLRSDLKNVKMQNGTVQPTNSFSNVNIDDYMKSIVYSKSVPASGIIRVPVILINFNDTQTKYNSGSFRDLLFDDPSSGRTLKDYFSEVSYGSLTIMGDVYGWYTSDKNYTYYDSHPDTLVYEAVAKADVDVNFSNYDNDGDGKVDVVIIIHQGTGEESSNISTDIWSHRSKLSAWNAGSYQTSEKAVVDDYTIQPEIDNGHISQIGIFAHELGHALGLPDLYDTTYKSDGVGRWDLMGSGLWNRLFYYGDTPAHLSAWSKNYLGFISPNLLVNSQYLIAEKIDAVEENKDVYKLLDNAKEYFLIENRELIGFDEALPGDGILIWHIDENQINNNNKNHKLVDLEEADGREDLDNPSDSNSGDATDPWYSNSAGFYSSSSPNSSLYSGAPSGVKVSEISQSSSTMTANLYVQYCDDKYDLKFMFVPGKGADASDSEPSRDFACIRTWVDHLGDSYWGQHHSLGLNENNLRISIDSAEYFPGDPVTFHLNITNKESVSREAGYSINLESKDPSWESAAREVHRTLAGSFILPPDSANIYNVTAAVPAVHGRIVNAVAQVEGERAAATFRVKPAYSLEVQHNLVELEPSGVNLTFTNTGRVSINGISISLHANNVEVHDPNKELSGIEAGQSRLLSWNVNPMYSGFSFLDFDIQIGNSGSVRMTMPARILAKPKLDAKIDSRRINISEPSALTAYITNPGDISLDNLSVELILTEGIMSDEPLIKNIGSLKGVKEIVWNITGTDFGNHPIMLSASAGNIKASEIAVLTVVEGGHDIDLRIDGNDASKLNSTLKGTAVNYSISVVNPGTLPDIVDIYVYPDGTNWTARLYDGGNIIQTAPYKLEMPPASTHHLKLELIPYEQVEVGGVFDVEMLAISEKDSSKTDRVNAKAMVISELAPLLEVNPASVSSVINHNSSSTFNITLANVGQSPIMNITITGSGIISSWISLNRNYISSLNVGQSELIPVTVSVPRYKAPDIYKGTINITSESGCSGDVQVYVNVPKSYRVESEIKPFSSEAVPGSIAEYGVLIKNEGNINDTYKITTGNTSASDSENISESWVSLSRRTILLSPGENSEISLDIMPPRRWSTRPGIYGFAVNVSSKNTYDASAGKLKVLNFSGVDVEITGSQVIVPSENPVDPAVERIIKENPSGRVKVIIKTTQNPGPVESAEVEKEGGKLKYTYHLINGLAAEVPAGKVKTLASKPFIRSIELDSEVHAFLDTSVPEMNVSHASGLSGRGVDVAVLDTGIDHSHPALRNIGLEYDFIDGDNYAEDQNGHGTHIAGIIASNDDTYRGVAPGAAIMPVKVLNAQGTGNSSDVIAGIEWAVDHGAEVITMSLGGAGGDGTSALSLAADSAVAKGVAVVAAAGNSGPYSGTIASPGDARNVITVGAVDDAGVIPYFSSRGPTTDGRTKPDVVAPGVDITSTLLNGGFASKTGTSMSAPHVAGAVALLIQAHHSDPNEIKEAITATAKDLGYDNNAQGAGLIDVDAADMYLSALMKPIVQNVRPGGAAVYDFELQNLGNINDAFDLSFVPVDIGSQFYSYPTSIQPGWVAMNSSLSAIPGEKISDNANIVVPDNWAGMTDAAYAFEIRAASRSNGSAVDNGQGILMINPTKRSMQEYIGLEIKWLSEGIVSLHIDDGLKNNLLNKTSTASLKNEQAISSLISGDEKKSNNMMGAEFNIINALLNEVQAQNGKGLSPEESSYMLSRARLIMEHIDKALRTPGG